MQTQRAPCPGLYAIGLALSIALAAPGAAQAQAPALAGQWESVAPEAMGRMHATRSFTFEGERWSIVSRAYGDAAATQPLFTLQVAGVFVLGGASAKVPGAWEGIFPAQTRRLTADSAAGAALFAGMGCTIERGKRLALINQGCGFVPGLMQAMGEYDLVAMKEDRLFFGDRAGDLTKTRPEALTPHPLRRR